MAADLVSIEGLRDFACECVLDPSLLARRLDLRETDIQQITYAHPNDRYEQIYQILYRWYQEQPQPTWTQLREAADSGIMKVMKRKIANDSNGEEEKTAKTYRTSEGSDDNHGNSNHSDEDTQQLSYTNLIPSAPPMVVDPPRTITTDDSSLLCYESDYEEVLLAVHSVTNWYHLGLSLKLSPPTLDDIRISNRDRVEDCRREMIKKWLEGCGKIPPSWAGLCQALNSPLVGNVSLAKRITLKYIS
jgi:hypothetical protein